MSSPDLRDHPPKPRLTLRVGITGKRVLPEGETARIRGALESIFDALAASLAACRAEHRTVLSAEPALLRITCGMAEGADMLAAEIALERYQREQADARRVVETRLAAILPFAKEEYEKDFASDPSKPKDRRQRTPEELRDFIARFEGMLAHPAVEAVLEIDDESLLGTANPDDRNIAYANLGAVLLDHTDVLVAVSDDIDGGPGGTVDVIRTAVREGVPVLKISTKKPQIHLMQAAALDEPDQTPKEDEEFLPGGALPGKLAGALDRILAPPPVQPPAAHASHEEGRPARERLEQFLGEVFQPAYFGRTFKAFRDGMTVKRIPGQWLFPKVLAKCRETWKKYRIDTPHQVAQAMWPAEYDKLAPKRGKPVQAILADSHGWADALAVRYADATRSSYIAIAVLGALAVLIGLLALLVPAKIAAETKINALLLEGIVLAVAAYYFFRPAHDGRWHQRVIEYRAIAELLRHARFIYMLGASDRLERTADRSWRAPDAWIGWYLRATLRELGFPSARLSAAHRRTVLDAFRQAELDGDYAQIKYNESVAERFIMIDERLGKVVRIAFWITVFAAIAGVVLMIPLAAFGWFHWHGHEMAHDALDVIKPCFTVVMAFVPALIAAIHGIRFQMEFRNTADRANATRRELIDISNVLKQTASAPLGRKYALYYVRAANEAMSSDLSGWSNVYRGKAPEPP